MTNSKVSALFGIDASPINWNRLTVLFFALSAESLLRILLFLPYLKLTSNDSTIPIDWAKAISLRVILSSLLADFLLVILVVAVFRFIRNGYIASAVLAGAYSLSWAFCSSDFDSLYIGTFQNNFTFPRMFVSFGLVLTLFICLELSLQVFNSLWLALLIGSLASVPLRLLVINPVLILLDGREMSLATLFDTIPFQIFTAAIFALTLALLLPRKTTESLNQPEAQPGTIYRLLWNCLMIGIASYALLMFAGFVIAVAAGNSTMGLQAFGMVYQAVVLAILTLLISLFTRYFRRVKKEAPK